MVGKTFHQDRIAKWELLFSKYQSAKSTEDYVCSKNLYESAQKINNEGPPEGVKQLIDEVWLEEGNEVSHTCHGCPISSKHSGSNDCCVGKRHTIEDNDTSVVDKTGSIVSLESSLADNDFDGKHDDSYDDSESYQCDFDSEDAKPLSVDKKEFFVTFCKAMWSRSRSIQQRRLNSASLFDALLEGRTSRENDIHTPAVSSPIKLVFSQKHSPQDSKGGDLGEILSTSATSTASQRDNNFASKQPCGNLSVQQSRIILVDVKSKSKLTEQSNASKESSFSEHINRMKIDSPSKPKGGETPIRVTATSEFYDNGKDMKNYALSSPVMSPTDGNRKQKNFRSPQGNCQRSPKFPAEESRVDVFPVKEGLIEDRKTYGAITKSSTLYPIHEMSSNISTQSMTSARSSSIDVLQSFLTSPDSANSSEKVTIMDSSVLRRRLSRERRSIRALKKGRSIFEV